jgi:hypothetical protein
MVHRRLAFRGRGLVVALFSMGVPLLSGCGSDASSRPTERTAQLESACHPPPPPRPQTKEACDACQGLWAIHGIVPVESCICRTSDGGDRCFDGRDCQGQCLVDRDIEFQVVDESEPPRGFYMGTCSRYDTTFGCHFVIPTGTEDLLPLPADEAARHLCID